MKSEHLDGVLAEIAKVKEKRANTSRKVELTTEERNEKVLALLNEGIKAKDVADRMGIAPGLVYQIKSSAKKDKPEAVGVDSGAETLIAFSKELHKESITPIKPLREKEIEVKAKPIKLPPKSSSVEVVEDKLSNSSSNENDILKSQINDLNRQLDRFRDGERNIRSEMITQKLNFEKQLDAEKSEKEKAYADYSLEVENNKRLRKQVEDLLMIDGLNVGLMQQNLMFRDRFGKMQEGERL